jgi:hypothetical protein
MYTRKKILRPLTLIMMAMVIFATGCGKAGLGPNELPSAPANFRITGIGRRSHRAGLAGSRGGGRSFRCLSIGRVEWIRSGPLYSRRYNDRTPI